MRPLIIFGATSGVGLELAKDHGADFLWAIFFAGHFDLGAVAGLHDLDHDIRVWLTAEQYAGLVRLARSDERSISGFVRRLIARALEESMEHDPQTAMAAAGARRDAEGL